MQTLRKPEVFKAERLLAEGVASNRAALGWTQEFLAQQCGVSTRTIWEVEAGVANPRLSTIAAIAVCVGSTVLGLLADGYDALAVAS